MSRDGVLRLSTILIVQFLRYVVGDFLLLLHADGFTLRLREGFPFRFGDVVALMADNPALVPHEEALARHTLVLVVAIFTG